MCLGRGTGGGECFRVPGDANSASGSCAGAGSGGYFGGCSGGGGSGGGGASDDHREGTGGGGGGGGVGDEFLLIRVQVSSWLRGAWELGEASRKREREGRLLARDYGVGEDETVRGYQGEGVVVL